MLTLKIVRIASQYEGWCGGGFEVDVRLSIIVIVAASYVPKSHAVECKLFVTAWEY